MYTRTATDTWDTNVDSDAAKTSDSTTWPDATSKGTYGKKCLTFYTEWDSSNLTTEYKPPY